MNIKQVLVIGFGVILGTVGLSAVVSNYTNHFVEQSQHWVLHTYGVQIRLKNIETNLLEAETGQRGFIYTGDEIFLEHYNWSTQNINSEWAILEDLVADNPQQIINLQNLKKLSEQKNDELGETIQLKRLGKEEELWQLVKSRKGQIIMNNIEVESLR
ncbi:CHASE3 domain-containing protein [Roseofilum sp. BLCC_M154]|uniref:CHASE3 domain-containing protein n=1 Tax=Roseofilum acuticapitatum BLCC-M154 TaxID=3022444 RepID=A0ABT7ANU0_9CYAN|nr:CHASE3 domain-containing protein [Roseofilum acuticapitatum]MDJ1168567.1 CHASE3 domain-containing protein [Roseofilum acuticapitatum BLCC-M154]